MAEHRDEHFAECPIPLDGDTFTNCVFERCDLVYSGGAVPTLTNCQFADCTWRYTDAALRTVQTIATIEGARQQAMAQIERLVQQLTEASRTPGSTTKH